METNFWDSQLAGVVIGSGIAGVFTILTQVLSNHRQKKMFAHDLKIRQRQFVHEREQEIRGRRTAALNDHRMRLEKHETALQNVWGYVCRPDLQYDRDSAGEGWQVLRGKDHLDILWPLEGSMYQTIIEYDCKLIELLKSLQSSFSNLQQANRQGVHEILSEELREAYRQQFEEVSTLLVGAKDEITRFTAKLNGISVDGEEDRNPRGGMT